MGAEEKSKVDASDAVAYETAAALYNEALTLYREQQMQHAIANFVAAVKLYPALSDGWNNLAIIAQALSMMDSATKFAALGISERAACVARALARSCNLAVFSPVERVAYIRSFASCHVNKFIQENQPIDREIALVYLRKALTISPTLEKEVRVRRVVW
jgi:tetratricopeptide (TPR) repeat protein